MFTWEISSLVLIFIELNIFDTDSLKRTGVNKESGKQRGGLLPNFSQSGTVEANGFDYVSGESII